jgi:phage recombination protein Bet
MADEKTAIVKTGFDAQALLAGEDMIYQTKWAGESTKLSLNIVKQLASTGRDAVINDIEALSFARTCKQYGFDPFLKEVYLIKYQADRPASTVIAAQTYLQIADESPDYHGYEMGWIVSDKNASRELVPQGKSIEGGKKIVGAWCQVFRKNRRTPVYEALLAEYHKPQANWKSMPQVMILKCVRGTAHRITYPNLFGNDVITEDEADIVCAVNEYEPEASVSVAPRAERTDDLEKDIQVNDNNEAEIVMAERFTELVKEICPKAGDPFINTKYDQFVSYVTGRELAVIESGAFVQANEISLSTSEISQCAEALKNGLPQAIVDLIPKPVSDERLLKDEKSTAKKKKAVKKPKPKGDLFQGDK